MQHSRTDQELGWCSGDPAENTFPCFDYCHGVFHAALMCAGAGLEDGSSPVHNAAISVVLPASRRSADSQSGHGLSWPTAIK